MKNIFDEIWNQFPLQSYWPNSWKDFYSMLDQQIVSISGQTVVELAVIKDWIPGDSWKLNYWYTLLKGWGERQIAIIAMHNGLGEEL